MFSQESSQKGGERRAEKKIFCGFQERQRYFLLDGRKLIKTGQMSAMPAFGIKLTVVSVTGVSSLETAKLHNVDLKRRHETH